MRCSERLEHRVEEDHRLFGRERSVLTKNVAQGSAAHQLHGQIDVIAIRALVIDGHHMAVGQSGRGLGLALEPDDKCLIVCQVGVHDFEGDRAIQTQIGGLVNGGHAATSDE